MDAPLWKLFDVLDKSMIEEGKMLNVKVIAPLVIAAVAVAVVVVFVFAAPKGDMTAAQRSAADKAATAGKFQKVEEPKIPTF